jgi:hypothetical protein
MIAANFNVRLARGNGKSIRSSEKADYSEKARRLGGSMTQVILQPVDKVHFPHTIEKSGPLSEILSLLKQTDSKTLRNEYPEGAVRVWGIKPGDGGKNVSEWHKIRKGGIVLFTRKSRVIGRAQVTSKTDNERLAKRLWPENATAETWKLIYFVDKFTRLAVQSILVLTLSTRGTANRLAIFFRADHHFNFFFRCYFENYYFLKKCLNHFQQFVGNRDCLCRTFYI